jgi:biotin carboxyl carrier protein
MLYHVTAEGKAHLLELKLAEGEWRCRLDDRDVSVDAVLINADILSLMIDGESFVARRDISGGVQRIFVNGVVQQVGLEDPRSFRNRRDAGSRAHGPQTITASMPGKIVQLLATVGEAIHQGQGIVVIEAMKMQNEIRSPRDGMILKLPAREGTNVNAGEVLAVIE